MIGYQNNNLFYSHSDGDLKNWSDPVQINDERGSSIGFEKLLLTENGEVYCIWVDRRRGFDLIFFSGSKDEGKTWSPNQAIDYDFRQGNQQDPSLAAGANGRILVFWQDWRDRKTLSDVRLAFSDDSGKTWSKSKKINDDEKEVWQIKPTMVSHGSNIYVAFADFREEGTDGDNDWNIYFARSINNGDTWESNTRLNKIKAGRDAAPILTIDRNGNPYCLWWTTRETLFGQMAFSYSTDKGNTWAPSRSLTSGSEMKNERGASLKSVSSDLLFASWGNIDQQGLSVEYFFIAPTSEELGSVNQREEEEVFDPLRFKQGEILFADDFSNDSAEKWDAREGVWNIIDKSYMGSKPGVLEHRFVSYAKFRETESYVMTGRFKLDRTAHMAASIYFRADESGLRQYVVKNQFRRGAWLSLKDDDRPIGINTAGGAPLVQKHFSFRQDRWYKFRLIVTPDAVDYYVDGKLILSHRKKLILPKGKIGVGGFSMAPTYFDDISISEILE